MTNFNTEISPQSLKNKKGVIFIEKIKKILIILIILVAIIYYFFISQNESEEINISNTILPVEEKSTEPIKKIKVYVTGEVNSQGVIQLDEGSRIEDAINLCGGLTPLANINNVNLAYVLEDGQKLYIPNMQDLENTQYISVENGDSIIESPKQISPNSKVNINKASVDELSALPGVGFSLASKIISYRNENGNFQSIEDLKNVSGIGDKKFESLKENICI